MDKSNKKCKLFDNLNCIYNTYNKDDYIYLGGEYGSVGSHFNNFKKVIKILYPNLKLNDISCYYSHIEHCICGHKIKQKCFIALKNKPIIIENLIILGNCCINIFYPNKVKKTCIKCKKLHKRKVSICLQCQSEVNNLKKEFNKFFKTMINFGIYKNKKISCLILDRNYYTWILSKKNEVYIPKFIKSDDKTYTINNMSSLFSYLLYIIDILKNLYNYDKNFLSNNLYDYIN